MSYFLTFLIACIPSLVAYLILKRTIGQNTQVLEALKYAVSNGNKPKPNSVAVDSTGKLFWKTRQGSVIKIGKREDRMVIIE